MNHLFGPQEQRLLLLRAWLTPAVFAGSILIALRAPRAAMYFWLAILALRVASLEPTLIRTWAVGGAPLDPEYEWHKVAKLWQTPEVGEQVMEKVTPETLAPGLVAAGVPAADAAEAARHVDATMKRSILALYRSGVRVGVAD